ncbi:elp4 [Scenedesmus sp. PABB004]|nr:elp4 [Scenedesmus sp. PABB004]
MSAFTRRAAPRAADAGTRPGLHGQTLISTGLAGLDTLLGGGLPLGCILLLLEDGACPAHTPLLRCFLGEGVACGHAVAWLTAQALSPAAAAAFLPQQAGAAPGGSGAAAASGGSVAGGGAGGGGGGGAAPAPPDDGLKIAWQYRKYIQRAGTAPQAQAPQPRQQPERSQARSAASSAARSLAAGVGREWCHQWDLGKGMSPEQLAGARLETLCCRADDPQSPGGAVAAAGAAAAAFAQRFQPAAVPSRDPGAVGRLVIQSLGGPEWWPDGGGGGGGGGGEATLEASILRAVAELRLAIQDASCAALVTVPAGLFGEAFALRLAHLGDAVVALQHLSDASDVFALLPDGATATALAEVRRLPHAGLLRQRWVDERLWLLRTKRRGVSLAPLDLLPLEAAERGGAGDARACGGGPAGGGGGGGVGGAGRWTFERRARLASSKPSSRSSSRGELAGGIALGATQCQRRQGPVRGAARATPRPRPRRRRRADQDIHLAGSARAAKAAPPLPPAHGGAAFMGGQGLGQRQHGGTGAPAPTAEKLARGIVAIGGMAAVSVSNASAAVGSALVNWTDTLVSNTPPLSQPLTMSRSYVDRLALAQRVTSPAAHAADVAAGYFGELLFLAARGALLVYSQLAHLHVLPQITEGGKADAAGVLVNPVRDGLPLAADELAAHGGGAADVAAAALAVAADILSLVLNWIRIMGRSFAGKAATGAARSYLIQRLPDLHLD